MARRKQRENYGNGSVSPIMVAKLDRNGNPVIDKATGKPVKVQKRDKDGRPVWRICITLGIEEYTDDKGRTLKRQMKAPQKTFHGTLEEARAACKQLNDQYEHVDKSAARLTFSDAVKAWEDSMRNAGAVANSTLAGYVHLLGFMENQFGDMALLDIREIDVDRAITAIRNTTNLGSTSIHKVFAATKRVFNFALKREWIIRNPLATMDSPRKGKVQTRKSLTSEQAGRLRAILDEAEIAAMKEFADKESRMLEWARHRTKGADKLWKREQVRGISSLSYLMAIRIMLATGMRKGETLALTWKAIDLEGSTIHVVQSLTQKLEVKQPKSKAGVRSIAIDKDTAAHLKTWKDMQAKALQRIRIKNPDGSTSALSQTDATPVCCNDAGSWIDPAHLNRWWDEFRKEVGFTTLKMHELRHTSATLLLGNGVDVKTVQTRLGHADSSLTLDFYAHAIPANDRAAADLMGGILGAPAHPRAAIIELPSISKTA